MDCRKAREIMWENLTDTELLNHLENCEECKKEYEIVKMCKCELSKSSDVSSSVIKKISSQKRSTLVKRLSGIAAAFLIVLGAVLIVNKIYQNPEKAYDTQLSLNGATKEDAGSLVGATDGQDPTSPQYDYSVNESESILDDTKESITKGDVLEFSSVLHDYKASNSISPLTADIIISEGSADISSVLSEFSLLERDGFWEADGEDYSSIVKTLSQNRIELKYTNSPENPAKTVIYLENNLY